MAFISNGDADALTVAQMRHELSRWLREQFALDSVRLNDILLAVNEALTNSAEFAYVDAEQGTMTMQVRYAADGDLCVTITDHGRWRDVAPEDRCTTRGRGLQLMRALADDVDITRASSGTTVRLRFADCPLISEEACATPA